jgi:lysophospholipase L1-like esterase
MKYYSAVNIGIINKIVIALILALLCWEALLEFTIIKHPGMLEDKLRGKIYQQGYIVWGEEGFSASAINSLGFRGKEIPPQKKDEFRIITLGDSFTEALQVPERFTFCNLLQSSLNKALNKSFNIINAGMSGYSPAYYIYLSNFYNTKLNPDYFIIQINDKDFKYDLKDKAQKFYIEKTPEKDFRVVKNYNDFQEDSLKSRIKEKISEFSTARVLKEKLESFSFPKKQNIAVREPVQPKKQEIEWALKQLKQRYKNFVILYMPDIDYFNNKFEPSEYETIVKQIAEENKIDIINPRQEFIKYYKLYHQPVNGFFNTKPGEGHLNKEGHKLTAKELFNYFKNKFQERL